MHFEFESNKKMDSSSSSSSTLVANKILISKIDLDNYLTIFDYIKIRRESLSIQKLFDISTSPISSENDDEDEENNLENYSTYIVDETIYSSSAPH